MTAPLLPPAPTVADVEAAARGERAFAKEHPGIIAACAMLGLYAEVLRAIAEGRIVAEDRCACAAAAVACEG